jgi:hypothetical protein
MSKPAEEIVAAVHCIATAREFGLCNAMGFLSASSILLTCDGIALAELIDIVTLAHHKALATPKLMELVPKAEAT